MSSWTDKNKKSGKSYNRKPYIKGDIGDYREMMDTVPRQAMLNERLEKKSQLDKPYTKKDYQDMEYSQPNAPSRLRFESPEFNYVGPNAVPGESEFPGAGTACILSCFSPLYCDDPVECHFGIIQGIPEEELYSGLRVYINGSLHRDIEVNRTFVRPIQIWPLSRTNGWAVWPNNPKDVILLEAWTKNDDGIPILRCKTKLDVFCKDFCCDNPPEGAFAFDDDSTADTIVAGSSIEVYITGGCPPFTFATSSTGYDFEGSTSHETFDRVATLNCASGSCGVDYDACCNINITDDCDSSVDAVIKNTGGQLLEVSCSEMNNWRSNACPAGYSYHMAIDQTVYLDATSAYAALLVAIDDLPSGPEWSAVGIAEFNESLYGPALWSAMEGCMDLTQLWGYTARVYRLCDDGITAYAYEGVLVVYSISGCDWGCP